MRKFYNDNEDLEGTLNVSFREDVQNSPPENARARLANATESDADRRTTAVMAHAQLKGVVEGVCPPSDVAADLEMVDQLASRRWASPPGTPCACTARCTSTRASRGVAQRRAGRSAGRRGDRFGGARAPRHPTRRRGRAPPASPSSRVVEPNCWRRRSGTRKAPWRPSRRTSMNTGRRSSRGSRAGAGGGVPPAAGAEASRRLLRQASFADAAARGRWRSSWKYEAGTRRGARRARRGGRRGDTAVAPGGRRRRRPPRGVPPGEAAADLVADEALADAIIERDAALAGERDAKEVTAVLKANVAFLREAGGDGQLEVSCSRRSREDRQNVAVRAAKEAKAAAAASENAVVAEKDAAGLREDVAALRKDVGEKREELETLRAKVDALESEDVRHQLKLARGRYADAENELGEARTQRRDAVERSKQLELDMEAADKERRAALRAQKKAETQMLELQREVAKLNGEKEALETELEETKATVASLELRVAELSEVIAAAEKRSAAHRRAGEGRRSRNSEAKPGSLRGASWRRRRRSA